MIFLIPHRITRLLRANNCETSAAPQTPPEPIPDPDAFAEQKQLVEAAIQLHARNHSLTVETVCAEAGVDESTRRV